MRTLEPADPIAALRETFLQYHDYFQAHPRVALLAMDQGLHSGSHLPADPDRVWEAEVAWIEIHLTHGQSAGLFDPALTARQVYVLMFSAIVGGFAVRPVFSASEGPASTIADSEWRELSARHFVAGLAPPPPG